MTLPHPPRWTPAIIETATGALAALILDAVRLDSYRAIRTQLTLSGCIGRVSAADWRHGTWPDGGRLQLHHVGGSLTSLVTPGPALHIGCTAGDEWIGAAASRGQALFVVIPPTSAGSQRSAASQPVQSATAVATTLQLADLVQSRQLTAGLATMTEAPPGA
ncbi:hypothetical protein ACIA49_38815 [Kribbella sp. NPDC051587]|uniref:hypothetical protein n=1 Tax=Kribbella sp. NPDC051587 TaxID=3364119 RepID=UPI003795B020